MLDSLFLLWFLVMLVTTIYVIHNTVMYLKPKLFSRGIHSQSSLQQSSAVWDVLVFFKFPLCCHNPQVWNEKLMFIQSLTLQQGTSKHGQQNYIFKFHNHKDHLLYSQLHSLTLSSNIWLIIFIFKFFFQKFFCLPLSKNCNKRIREANECKIREKIIKLIRETM